MVLAAKTERTPLAQYTTTGRDLSGIRPSTWNSRCPRGRWIAPGIAPCSYSSASRTSSSTTSSRRGCTSSPRTSPMADLAWFNSSRALATPSRPSGSRAGPSSTFRRLRPGHLSHKPYQRGQHSRGSRLEADGRLGSFSAMELSDAVHRRRMVRSFSPDPVPADVVDGVLELACSAPTAGNTGGWDAVVLVGPEETAAFWDATTTADWRARSRRWAGLSRAPVVVAMFVDPDAYQARYRQPDKEASGL